MIPVLHPEQIRKLDQLTIEEQKIAPDVLMERAGTAACEWLLDKFKEQKHYTIYCGFGNNGGDGLVLARLLCDHAKSVKVCLVEGAGKPTDLFDLNLKRLTEQVRAEIITLTVPEDFITPDNNTLVIDAIFGNGLNRPPQDLPLALIHQLNKVANPRISLDIPSGMLQDKPAEKDNCFHADFTLCFGVPRLAFLFPETGWCCGDWHLLDIGYSETALKHVAERTYVSEKADLQHWLKPRNIFAYKNNFGHALLLAGSLGKSGAAILASRACLRAGAGLLTVRTPAACVTPLQTAVPEAMVRPDSGMDFCDEPVFPLEYNVIGAGPGIGTEKGTGNVLKRLFQDYKGALVLDADAINLLAENKTWLDFLPHHTILTPHQGEFKRLAGEISDPFERLNVQVDFSKRYQSYVVLKGRYTMISCPDGTVIINLTGNPGMASAGSGDVLTGIITGLRAQGQSALAASVCGVYLHGLAGDLAAAALGENSMIASDITERLPEAFRIVMQH